MTPLVCAARTDHLHSGASWSGFDTEQLADAITGRAAKDRDGTCIHRNNMQYSNDISCSVMDTFMRGANGANQPGDARPRAFRA